MSWDTDMVGPESCPQATLRVPESKADVGHQKSDEIARGMKNLEEEGETLRLAR